MRVLSYAITIATLAILWTSVLAPVAVSLGEFYSSTFGQVAYVLSQVPAAQR